MHHENCAMKASPTPAYVPASVISVKSVINIMGMIRPVRSIARPHNGDTITVTTGEREREREREGESGREREKEERQLANKKEKWIGTVR